MSKKIPAVLCREVIGRAKGLCGYCRTDSGFSDSPFDVEHIIPLSENGATELENPALACHGCNLKKSNKTKFFDAISQEFSRLYNPRKDIWKEHFGWSEGYSIAVGLTPVGRVTIELLELNRNGLINRRKALFAIGRHPPH